MAIIDDKVVAMSFEGGKFESGVRGVISAIDKLKAALKFDNAGKGLDDISKASKRVDFSSMASSLSTIKDRLGALRLAAIATFSQIATRAISAGASFVKSFTFAPIRAGFQEYTTNLNAVQTILANTQAAGTKLKDVNAALLDLNRYSDKTIYNFSQMAKNIGTFTAAGVDLQTSTAAIKGIANLAALSGSNAEQASTAMYQLSQAIASGRVSLQDWNSVVNAGMGGTIFQRALAQTAVAMGKLKDGAVQLEGPMKNVRINGESFRQSIGGPGPKWLTSDILTNTLKQFTSDMTVAQLKAQGFNDAQIKAIQTTAQTAMHAATEVKTISQVLDVAREAAGSGWAQTWQIIFGNFGEAKTLFTGVSNAVNGFINASAQARNKVLADWKALGGRTILINSIKTAFQALGAILRPIKDAFRDIFPATTGRDLLNLTLRFKAFAEALRPSPETVENLRRTFRGLFAVLDIGRQIVSGIFTVFSTLFHAIGGGNGSFLNFTGNIGDFLVKVDQALKKGNAFHNFFVSLGNVIAVPVKLLQQLGHAIANLFSGFSPGGFSGEMASLADSARPFQTILENIGQSLQGLGPAIGNALANINWEVILDVVRTGLLGGLFLMIRKFIGNSTLPQLFGIFGKSIGRSIGGGLLGNLSKAFGGLTGTLSAMQTELKARTLEEIAIAIALLAASVLALSLVDPDRLSGALGAMTIMFAELLAAMAIMDKVTTMKSFVKLPFIAASLILLAVAIDLLTLSVLALSRLSWSELLKGLAGVGGLLAGLSAASVVLSKNSAGMIRSSVGILAIAVAMKILASAMEDFGQMNWTQIAKGLVGVAGGLAAIAATMQLMPKNMVLRSAAIIGIAAALEIIADVVTKFGAMNWGTIAKGLAGVGGSLIAIAAAMHVMPKGMVLQAAGLLLVAASLGKIQDAVEDMGGLSLKQMAKGLIGLGAALVILAVGMHAMSGAVGGAFALGLAATGLALLVPTLVLLGRQSWSTLLKGLIGLAAAIAVIAGAALLLMPSIPALLGFGAALVVIGAGLALAGAGIALIGIGLSAIAVSGSAAVGILVGALGELVAALVDSAKNIVLGVLEIVKAFANTAPQFATAIEKILDTLLDIIIQASPKIALAFEALLLAALQILNNNSGKVIQAGMNLILALLTGIKNNIGQVLSTTVGIVTTLLGAIASNLGRIITAGASILASIIKGIASGIGGIATTVLTIIARFLSGIASNLGRIATAGLSIILRFISAIVSRFDDILALGTSIVVKFINGIGNAGSRVITAGTNTIIKLINALSKNGVKLANAGAKAITDFMNGIAKAIDANAGPMRAAGWNIGVAIIDGMTGGLASKGASLIAKAGNIASGVLHKLGGVLHLGSPSRATFEMGEFLMQGLANGMAKMGPVLESAEDLGNSVISTLKNVFQITSPSKVTEEIGEFVGEGFAKGLRGSTQDIKEALADLNKQLLEGMKKAREAHNQAELVRLTAAHETLTKSLKDEQSELVKLSIEYEKVGNRLAKAKDVLAEARKTRDDAVRSFSDQYSTLPDIVTTDAEGNSIDQLANYMEALKHQADAISAYQSTLQQLRKLGLDDATYQKLLKEGPADAQFAAQILAGGKDAVQSLNTLDANLERTSKTLATNAAKNLYQAGVDSAAGLVKGLENKKGHIRKIMEDIAEEMLRAMKTKLKIKSPSEAFMEIGEQSMTGMAQGFSQSDELVDAVNSAAQEALAEMEAAMREMERLSAQPTITPVLDFSRIEDQSQDFSGILSGPNVLRRSTSQATAIAAQQTVSEADAATAAAGGTSIVFNQTNNSPEALSDVEIYRNTKNQLSQLKSVFAV